MIVFHGITAKAYKKRCADVSIRCHASLWRRAEVGSEEAAVAGTVSADGEPMNLRSASEGVWSVFSQVRES